MIAKYSETYTICARVCDDTLWIGFKKFSSPFKNGICGICSDPHNTGHSPAALTVCSAFTLSYASDVTHSRICDSLDFRIANTPYPRWHFARLMEWRWPRLGKTLNATSRQQGYSPSVAFRDETRCSCSRREATTYFFLRIRNVSERWYNYYGLKCIKE